MSASSMLDLEECKALFTEAQTLFSKRKTLFDKMENMFFLVDNELPTQSWIRKAKSPDPRNYILGAVRLLTATRPKWKVPRNTNPESLKEMSDDIESTCDAITYISGMIDRPVEVEAALSAMIYGEVHLKVVNTKALMEAQKKEGAKKERAKYTNMRTPLIFECVNPKIGFPIYDIYGLSTYCSVEKVSVDFIWSKFGPEFLSGKKRTEKVNLYELWNDDTHAAWCDGEDKELLLEENTLGFIPVFCELVEGSDFFVEENQPSRQPLLYGYGESGLWNAQNMALTIMSSLALSIVASPMLKFKQAAPTDKFDVQHGEVPWGVVVVPPGADVDVLVKQVIDPSIPEINRIAEQKGMESSIYKQTLGDPLGNNAAFSTLSLASSAGRLPLIPYQRCVAHVFAKAMYYGLLMLKQANIGKTPLAGPAGSVDFDFNTLPDSFILECDLEISVPQDDRENVALAVQATQGDNPLVSMEYARENWLKIGQSKKMQEDIWEEQRLLLMNQIDLQAKMEAAKAQAQGGGGVTPPGGPTGTINATQNPPEVGPGGERGTAQISPATLGKNSNGIK